MQLYSYTGWRERVEDEGDREYLEELIGDLAERMQHEPEAVFKQLNDLSTGMLIANDVEVNGFLESELEMLGPAPGEIETETGRAEK